MDRRYILPDSYEEIRNSRSNNRRRNNSNRRTTFTFKCPVCGYTFRLRKERTVNIFVTEGDIYDLSVTVDVRCPNCYCGFYFDCYYSGKKKEETDYWTYCDNDIRSIVNNYSEGFLFTAQCSNCEYLFRFRPDRNSLLINFNDGKITFKVKCPNCGGVQRTVFRDVLP